MSVWAMSIARKVRGLTSAERVVLFIYADHAGIDGRNAFPSVALVARDGELCERKVRYAVAKLRRLGHLEVQEEASQHRPTVYRLFPWAADGYEEAAAGLTQGCTKCTPELRARGAQHDSQGCTLRPSGVHSSAAHIGRTVSEPSKNQEPPKSPADRGGLPRVTRAERKQAEAMKKASWGGCPHDPHCITHDECVIRIVMANRALTAEALAAAPP